MKRSYTYLKGLLTLALAAFTGWMWAAGESICIGIDNNSQGNGPEYSGATTYGWGETLVAGDNWNNTNGATISHLKLSNGDIVKNAAFTVTAKGGDWRYSAPTQLGGGIRDYADGPWNITLSGIPFSEYSVVLFMASDVGNKTWGPVKVTSGETATYYTYDSEKNLTTTTAETLASWGNTALASGYTAEEGVNVMVIPNLSGSVSLLTHGSSGTAAMRGSFYAIQIINTGDLGAYEVYTPTLQDLATSQWTFENSTSDLKGSVSWRWNAASPVYVDSFRKDGETACKAVQISGDFHPGPSSYTWGNSFSAAAYVNLAKCPNGGAILSFGNTTILQKLNATKVRFGGPQVGVEAMDDNLSLGYHLIIVKKNASRLYVQIDNGEMKQSNDVSTINDGFQVGVKWGGGNDAWNENGGLVVDDVILWNGKFLSDAEVEALVAAYPAILPSSSEKTVEANAKFTDLNLNEGATTNITITLKDGVTLDMDKAPTCATLTIISEGSATVTTSVATPFANVDSLTLNGEALTIPALLPATVTMNATTITLKGGTAEAPQGVAKTIAIASGKTLKTEGYLNFSSVANTIASGGTLEVVSGVTTFNAAVQGIRGTLTIDKGATFKNVTTDTLAHDTNGVVVNVYGKLDMGSTRWTIFANNNTINAYAGATITGAGQSENGALDVWREKDTDTGDHVAINVRKNGEDASDVTISATIRYRAKETIFDVAEGMTANLTGTNADVNTIEGGLKVKGAGTLKLSGKNAYANGVGVTVESDATLIVAHAEALSTPVANNGTITYTIDATPTNTLSGAGVTGVNAATLNMLSANLGGYTGTFAVANNGTLILPAGKEAGVTVPSGCTLNLALSDTDKAGGYTSQATINEGGIFGFVEADGSTPVTEGVNGGTYTPQAPTWTPTSAGSLWTDSNLWTHCEGVPTSGDVVVDYSALTTDITVTIPEGQFNTVTLKGGASNKATLQLAGSATVGKITVLNNAVLPVALANDANVTIVTTETATLTIDVAENTPLTKALTIDGALVKGGTGALTMNANFKGATSTTVGAGTLKYGTAIFEGDITVGTNAKLDYNGKAAGYTGVITLETGAFLVNNGDNIGSDQRQLGGIVLNGNATIGGSGNFGLIAGAWGETQLTLNGHKLTKTGTNGFWICNTTVTDGELDIQGGRIAFENPSGQEKTTTIGNVKVTIAENAALNYTAGTINWNGNVTKAGAGTWNLFGSFAADQTFKIEEGMVSVGGDVTLNRTISGSGTLAVAAGGIVKNVLLADTVNLQLAEGARIAFKNAGEIDLGTRTITVNATEAPAEGREWAVFSKFQGENHGGNHYTLSNITLRGNGKVAFAGRTGNGSDKFNQTLNVANASDFSGEIAVINIWNRPIQARLAGEQLRNAVYNFDYNDTDPTESEVAAGKKNLIQNEPGIYAELLLTGDATLAGLKGGARTADQMLSGAGNDRVRSDSGDARTLTLNVPTGATPETSAIIGTASNPISLIKTGAGKQTFTVATKLKSLTVNEGTVAFTDFTTTKPSVEVVESLSGTGTIEGTVSLLNGSNLDVSTGVLKVDQLWIPGGASSSTTVTLPENPAVGDIIVACKNPDVSNLVSDLSSKVATRGFKCKSVENVDGYEGYKVIKLAVTVNVTIPTAPANTKWYYKGAEVSGTIAVDPNTDVTLILKADTDYVFADGTTEKEVVVNSGAAGATVEMPNVTAATPVAQVVGGNKYQTLAAAIAAAQAGDTVTLLANVTASDTLTIAANTTIDLNGKSLTSTANPAIHVTGGTLTLMGGVSIMAPYVVIQQGTKNDGLTTKVVVGESVHLTSFRNEGDDWDGDNVVLLYGKATLESAGVLVTYSKGYAAIQGSGGDAGADTSITITGGQVVNNGDVAIYHPQKGTLTITGGEISGSTAIYAKAGTVSISGGTISANGAQNAYGENHNGCGSTGDALVIDETAGYADLSVSITGGAFTSAHAAAVASYAGVGQTAATGIVKAGATATFSSDVSDLCVAGYKTVANDEGRYVVVADPVYGKVAKVGDTYYATLAEAIAVAQADDTITLLANVATDVAIEVTKKVTIDLNEKTVATTQADTEGNGVFWVKTNGDLTINGNGTINGVGGNKYNIAIWADGGKVTINGGTYTNVGAQDSGPDGAHFDLIYVKNGGSAIITGGTFICETPAWTLNSHDTAKGTISVTGGKFLGFNPANCATEGPNTNWCDEGYIAVEGEGDDAGYYIVVESTIPENLETALNRANVPVEGKAAIVKAMAKAGVTEISSCTITTKNTPKPNAEVATVADVLAVFEVTPTVDAGVLTVAYEFGISNINNNGNGTVAITAGVTGAEYRAGVTVTFYADGAEIGSATTTADSTTASIEGISVDTIKGKKITVKAIK